MIYIKIHSPAFGNRGHFMAASGDVRLHAVPAAIDAGEHSPYQLKWVEEADTNISVNMTKKMAMEYITWLGKVRRLIADCEDGRYVCSTGTGRYDLAGIDTRDFNIRKPDAANRIDYLSATFYKHGRRDVIIFNDESRAETFSALLEEYVTRMEEINDGNFRLFHP